MDAAFVGAGKKEGVEMWRIENLQPMKLELTASLYEGDSYILLSTVKKGNALTWNLHFWLGKDTSQDEAGTAAYKTVELDEGLGGGPVQYREVQGSESALFLSYFKHRNGIQYLPGGVASGFKHVETGVYPTRLLEVKGKTVPRVNEVPLTAKSLTQHDAFVLDMGLEIFVWNGANANRQEKIKAMQYACSLDDDQRGGKASVYKLEDDPKNEKFWGALGGYVDPSSIPAGLPDAASDDSFVNKLFRIASNGAEVGFTAVDTKGGKLSRDMLVSDDVFLVHSLEVIFIWVGKKASPDEKKQAMSIALKYLGQTGLPTTTPIQKVCEGVEPGSFIKEFYHWVAKKEAIQKANVVDSPIDVSSFVGKIRQDDLNDDIVAAQEKVQIWRIESFKAVEEDPSIQGQFYSGDSYIVLYSYKKTSTSKEEHIIYFWLGRNSSTDEKGAAALLTKDLDDKMGGSPVQCRIVEGKEPLHFRRLFKGKMIIHKGGVPSGFKKTGAVADSDSAPSTGNKAYCVRGATPLSTVAIEVDPTASVLDSSDCFVVTTADEVFVFKGKNSTAAEKAVAESVAGILANGKSVVGADEGAEPDAFWSALGGKADYAETEELEEDARDPRLFLCSTESGRFTVEEICDFDQSDLDTAAVLLLDVYDEVYIWIGHESSGEEEKKASEFAAQYIAAAAKKDGRALTTATIRIDGGKEPNLFTRYFVNWDDKFADKNKFVDPYEAKRAQMAKTKGVVSAPAPAKPEPTKAAVPVASPGTTYSYDVLKTSLPAGVDHDMKELYLSDADFVQVFKVSKADFAAMPKWKKDAKKKEVGLF